MSRERRSRVDEGEARPSIILSPSADQVLEVTPVNSTDEIQIPPPSRVSSNASHPNATFKPPFLPPTSTSPIPSEMLEDGDFRRFRANIDTEGRLSPAVRSATAEDAFSSSSSDNDSVEEGDLSSHLRQIGASQSKTESGKYSSNPQSEFDKALLTGEGVPNTASFDVPRDTASEYLSQAEHTVLHEVLSSEENIDLTPDRKQPRRPRPRSSPQITSASQQPPPPPPLTGPIRQTMSLSSRASDTTTSTAAHRSTTTNSTAAASNKPRPTTTTNSATIDDVSTGVLPDVLMTMRQKIESLTLFDSDMMRLAQGDFADDDRMLQETRESLKRSSQQSISAAVLVSLAHKRYERRRLAAMEIEKVVRSLVQQGELERVRAILLLLSDDYVRSSSEDARKGGVVALAASAIGLKKGKEDDTDVLECRDLILASVVHACQDHSQRVRYYATESLFNVLKAIPALAVQHFFILFEILRSLYADVDVDVRSGAQLLDKRLKEWIVGAINSGSFSADNCVPVFARFVYMRNKATKKLTLTWLQELNEKLIGNPVLEFLHLFLGGIFTMVADPNVTIKQSALAFLQSVLPKLLMQNEAFEDDSASAKVDFDKILQSLVTTLEHPDPFVRKVAMFWMCRIVSTHMTQPPSVSEDGTPRLTAASISVRNSLPHVLPGVLLSIGDTFNNRTAIKDSFLPEQTTRSLAEQTNKCLQDAVRRDGSVYVPHLDGFIVALREELDSPGGMQARAPPAVERKPYRIDVTPDGSGIERPGWFRTSDDSKTDESTMLSRLCALNWIIVLYESVVPHILKAEYAREFVTPIIHQLVHNPPESIIFKSLEVLAIITVPVEGEKIRRRVSSASVSALASTGKIRGADKNYPMTDEVAEYALEVIGSTRRQFKSRDRQVFAVLIRLHAHNHQLLGDLSRVIQLMCQLQPPEFVLVSFAVELDHFLQKQEAEPSESALTVPSSADDKSQAANSHKDYSRNLEFVSAFVQQMSHVLFFTEEGSPLRDKLKDCIGQYNARDKREKRIARLFHILLHSFAHNLASSISLCLWGGANKTAAMFLRKINPLDISLIFLVEIDKMIEMLERPLFRHLHVRMLECDKNPRAEGSGAMLFQGLKSLLMLIPQSTCYRILRDRLMTVSRFRQSALAVANLYLNEDEQLTTETAFLVERVLEVRRIHCNARWRTIRAESLETAPRENLEHVDVEDGRRSWLGYLDEDEAAAGRLKYQQQHRLPGAKVEEIRDGYEDLSGLDRTEVKDFVQNEDDDKPTKDSTQTNGSGRDWMQYWTQDNASN